MRFVVSGKVRVEVAFRNFQVKVEQTLAAPNVLAPDYLFGLDTTYPFTVTALGECGIMQLRKADYIKVIQSDKVFLFNILNYLSLGRQRFITGLLDARNGSVVERIALITAILTTQVSKDVTFSYRQKDLCALLGAQRATLIHALDQLQDMGAIQYTTNQFNIIDLKFLRNKL